MAGSRVNLQWAGATPPPPAETRPPPPPPPEPPPESAREEERREPREREWTLGVDTSDAVTSTWVGVAPEWAGDAMGRIAEVEQGAFALPEGANELALGATGSPGGMPTEVLLTPPPTSGASAASTGEAKPGDRAPAQRTSEASARPEEEKPATTGKIEKQEESKSAPTRGANEDGATDARGEREGLDGSKKDDGGDKQETLEKREATTLPPVTDLESRGTAKEPTSAREETSAQEQAEEQEAGDAGATGEGEAQGGNEGAVMPPALVGQGGSGGGVVEISTQGQVSDKESEATALKDRVQVRPGQPVAAKGLEIKTRRPVFSLYTRVTAAPRNAVVRVRFTREGKVASAEMVRSSGVADVDRPILDAVYGWTASGKQLLELPETREGEKPATVSIVFEIVLR